MIIIMFRNGYEESVKSMRNRTIRLDRHGDYWAAEEKEKLVRKFNEGEGITAMALEFQRTESAIIQQIETMDLYGRKKKNLLPSSQVVYVPTVKMILHYVPDERNARNYRRKPKCWNHMMTFSL